MHKDSSSFIKLNNVSLDYVLKTGSNSIRNYCIQAARKVLCQPVNANSFNSTYRALNNISLDIQQGDKIGILGGNGAGKSTLLRVLAQIYRPNIGEVTTRGTTSCLFSIGLGLNPEATGLENVITLNILRGLTKADAKKMADEILEFTELGDFFTKPVRMYSSGMAMKLAFGVATAGSPDILLIDEVIGVGDGRFMQKALSRLETLMHKSNILVLTSHDTNWIKKFCTKALVLNNGTMSYYGEVDGAIEHYNHILFPAERQTLIDNTSMTSLLETENS